MSTFLFVWNPAKWPWPEITEDIEKLAAGEQVREAWNCVSHKKVKTGDRAFFSRVGSAPRGLFAAGRIASEPFLHKTPKGKEIHHVLIDFDTIINPDTQAILTIELLNIGALSKQLWTPQSSGITINDGLVPELEAVWADFLESFGEAQ